MTNLALENYEVSELSLQEANETDAGGIWGVAAKVVGYVLIAASVYADSQGW